MEDVLRMRGERIGNPGQRRGGPGHGRCHRGEVRVQVGDLVCECQAGDLQSLDRIVVGEFAQLAEVVRQGCGQVRLGGALGPGLPEAAGRSRALDVDDLGPNPGELGVEAGVRARAQGEDDQFFPGGLAGEDLGDDEGLGEARVHFEHIGSAATRTAGRLGGFDHLGGCGLRRHGGSPPVRGRRGQVSSRRAGSGRRRLRRQHRPCRQHRRRCGPMRGDRRPGGEPSTGR